MTKHDKPLSEHDKRVLADLAEIEKHGVPKDEPPVFDLDGRGGSASLAFGPSASGMMMDGSGIGIRPTPMPSIASEDSPLRELQEEDEELAKERDVPTSSLPKIDTGED